MTEQTKTPPGAGEQSNPTGAVASKSGRVSWQGPGGWLARQRGAHFFFIALLATGFALLVHSADWPILERIDNFSLDKDFRMRPVASPSDISEKLPNTRDIVLIETTHQLPRPILAKLLDRLRYAKVVGLDLMIVDDEAQLTDDERPLYAGLVKDWRKELDELTRSFRANGRVVLSAWPEMVRPQSLKPQAEGANSGLRWDDVKPVLGWERPPMVLWKSARYQAHVRVEEDPVDHSVRRIPLFENVSANGDTQLRPSLGLAMAAAACDVSPSELIKLSPKDGYLTLGKHRVCVGPSNLMTIDYVGDRSAFEGMSNHNNYTKVLDYYEPEDFAGKIVIVGESSIISKEIFNTPMGQMPGMQIHANMVATLLSDKGAPLGTSWPVTALFAFFMSALLAAPLGRWSLWTTFCLAAVELAAIIVLAGAIFVISHRVLPASVPILAVFLTLNALALYEYWRVRRTLGRFIGNEMVTETLQSFMQLRLGGRNEEASAFFCDLRGYSALSETMSAAELAVIMNQYTDLLVHVVRRYGGRPIDYQGDGVFVLFERAFAGKDFPLQAIKAALEMLDKFSLLRDEWARDGAPTVEIGIGIDTGDMMIGAVGSSQHMKLGAIGDSVNVAARVQRLNVECGYDVLFTRHTYELVRDQITAHYCGVRQVHGRRESVEIFGLGERVNSYSLVKQGILFSEDVDLMDAKEATLGGSGRS